MNLFDRLVEQALKSDRGLGMVRPAVEKELLHHDILREMSRAGLLKGLIFIGGTCLRACYGSMRLSEDLDFAGGFDFDPGDLAALGHILELQFMEKYGLPVSVSEPVREEGNTCTWKLRVQTRPVSKHLPAQRIHIDVCALPGHDGRPSFLRNVYGVDMGTGGLIIQVESLESILADKWIALAFRPNRIKYRDVWDIIWLEERQGVHLDATLVSQKLEDRKKVPAAFVEALEKRVNELSTDPAHRSLFRKEISRFLFIDEQRTLIESVDYWNIVILKLKKGQEALRAVFG